MSNVTVANQNEVAVPQNLAALFGGVESNISSFQKVNQLKIAGKVWRMQVDGQEQKLTTMVEGEVVPLPMVKVIVINQNPNRSRAMFEGGFEEGTNKAPVCWSEDGKYPDSRVTEPQSPQCQGCPNTVKGSAFTDKGEPTTACKVHKDIAVIPSNKGDFPALKCRLSTTSLWEANDTAKPKEAQGWYAFDAYCKFLASRGINHTAMVETMMKFDADVNYPKVLFKFSGYITEDMARVVAPRINSEEVANLCGLGKKEERPQIPAPQPKPEVKPEVVQESDPFTIPEQPAKVEQPKTRKPRETKPVEQPKVEEVKQEPVVVETDSEFEAELAKALSWD